MRTLLVTGAGGAGRSTVAAATALRAARAGERVLLLTPDGAALDAVEGVPGLTARRLDAAADARGALAGAQERGAALLDFLGAAPLAEEELTDLPGAGELALLAALGRLPRHDLAVVDLPPLPDGLRLLALPAQLRRWLRRLLPPERQAARALRPVLAQLAGVPVPAQRLYETAERWDAWLAGVQDALDDPRLGVRIVVEPDARAAELLRPARAALAVHGRAAEAVVAGRVLPAASPDPWLAAVAARQQSVLKRLGEDVRELPHLGRDPDDAAALAQLADALGDPADPGRSAEPWTVDDRLADEGALVWRLPLPGAVHDDLGLVRRGDELIVDLGPYRHVLPLPAALRRCAITRARLRDGELRVRFEPDRDVWPRRTGRQG